MNALLRRFLAATLAIVAAMLPLAAFAQQAPTTPPYASIGGQVTMAVTAASSNVALPAATVPFAAVTIYNQGSNDAFVRIGASSVVAATTGYRVSAGTGRTIWIPSPGVSTAGSTNTYIAAITSAGTTTLVVDQATGPTDMLAGAGAASGGGFPVSATPITASAVGTTAATTATLAAAAGKLTYICGFTITADATAAIAGAASVTGTVGGTLNYIQDVGAATAAATLPQTFAPCLPSSAVNTAIAVVSLAAGTGGNTAVTAWGYQQ